MSPIRCSDCIHSHYVDRIDRHVCMISGQVPDSYESCTSKVRKSSFKDDNLLYTVVTKLVGEIEPTGDSSIDAARYENLIYLLEFFDLILPDVVNIQKYCNIPTYSESRSGKYTRKWIKDTVSYLNDCLSEFED